MRTLFALLLFSATVNAQSTFQVFDTQWNVVTGDTVYITSTDSTFMQVNLYVRNNATGAKNVKVARTTISQPVNAANAYTWNQINHAPSADTSVTCNIPASIDTMFEGYYFPQSSPGPAIVNYCFFEVGNLSNIACVTVVYNYSPLGITESTENATFTFGPNPASEYIGFGCSHCVMTRIDVYSSTGLIVLTRDIKDDNRAEFNVADWAPGLYFYAINSEDGFTMTGTFLR